MLASSAGCSADGGHRWRAALATLSVVLLTSCGDADTASSPTPSADSADSASSGPSGTDDPPPQTIDFAQLYADGAQLDGEPVSVIARVFFLEQCPPPSTVPTPCSLSLFITETERDHLVYADRTTAVPVFDADGRVTCHVGSGVTTACPGWEHGSVYELTGTVRRAAAEPGFELHITEFTLINDGSG